MPPRARRLHAQGPGPGPGPGPVPGMMLPPPAPPLAVQHYPFHAPPPPPFHPSYARGHPDPGQYHHAGLGMNVPPFYAQPYGAPPAPYPPFHPPHFAPYPGVGNAQLQPWGYGHYPVGPLPEPVPQPVAQPDNATGASPVYEAQGHATVAPGVGVIERDTHTGAGGVGRGKGKASTAAQPKKSYPHKKDSEGGTSYSGGEILTADIPKFGSFWSRSAAT